MVGTREARRENEPVHALYENFVEFRVEGTRYMGNRDIYTYGATKYLTYRKNHMTMNLKRFMIGFIFAPYPGLSRKRIWAIIDSITNDSKNEQEMEFVHKKTSREGENKASVICAAIQEHRAVLGLMHPQKRVSIMKRMASLYPAVFRVAESRTRAQGGDEAD